MINNIWKENRVVKRICELRKDYEFRFAFAGIICPNSKIQNMFECNCCGTLWRAVPKRIR